MPSFPIIGWPSWEPPAPSEGPPGPPGPAGAAGPTGRRGYGTALQVVYEFVGSDPSPEAGALSIEVADPVWDSTWARLAFLDDDSASRVTEIIGMADSTNPVKGTLRIEAITDPSRWATFDLTDVAPNNVDHYCSLDVENGNAWDGSAFTVGERVAVTFSRAGDKGDGSAVPDASGSTKGIMKLAGDLGGTAAAPTVPGLTNKANTTHTHTEADVIGLSADLATKASAAALVTHVADTANPHQVTKSQVGLGNVTDDAQLTAAQLDVDGTLAANSDLKVASQKATRTYIAANAAPPVAVRRLIPAAKAVDPSRWVGTKLTGDMPGSAIFINPARGALGLGFLQKGAITDLCIIVTQAGNVGDISDVVCYRTGADGLPAALLWSQGIPTGVIGDISVTGLSLSIPSTGLWCFGVWGRPGNGIPALKAATSIDAMSTMASNGSTTSWQIRPTSGTLPADLSSWGVQGGSGLNVLAGFSMAPVVMARGIPG